MSKGKYADCIVTLPIHKFNDTELMHGADILNGFACAITYAYAFTTGITGSLPSRMFMIMMKPSFSRF